MDIVADAFQNLVTQFSSALDFYRELVQNSMDAGSSSIEVWLEFLPDEDAASGMGTMVIHVDDFGEGMNEEIIDKQLTTLFSSTKENDLTKVGKFGIGFVSIFAMKPKAVIVHTGREGEYWEVFFNEEGSLTKTHLETPVEGTQIALYIPGDRATYRELVASSLETLRHWCGHSDVEIAFEDRSSLDGEIQSINQPFEVAGDCMQRVETDDGSQIVLAYSTDPSWGFYNKGLALAVIRGETDLVPQRLKHVNFKIKSRYLEHTLSRETVMRDQNFERAMDMLGRAADTILHPALLDEIEALVQRPDWDLEAQRRYAELAAYWVREPIELLETAGSRQLLRTVDGQLLTLDQVWGVASRDDRVFIDGQPGELSESLGKLGAPVLYGPAGRDGPIARILARDLLRRLSGSVAGEAGRWLREQLRGDALRHRVDQMIVRPSDVVVRVVVDRRPDSPAARLATDAGKLLRAAEKARPDRNSVVVGYSELACCALASSRDPEPLYLTGPELTDVMLLPPAGSSLQYDRRRSAAALNVAHPQLRALVSLYETQPRMAAYCLAKNLLLEEDRLLWHDLDLMMAAHEYEREGTL